MKKNKKFGWVIIIEGYSGSGKSSIAKAILNFVKKKIGATALLDGDDVRRFMKSINFKMRICCINRAFFIYKLPQVI